MKNQSFLVETYKKRTILLSANLTNWALSDEQSVDDVASGKIKRSDWATFITGAARGDTKRAIHIIYSFPRATLYCC